MKANVKQPKSTSYNSGLCNTILADNTSADRSLKVEHTAWLLCLLIHSVVLRDLQYWGKKFQYKPEKRVCFLSRSVLAGCRWHC